MHGLSVYDFVIAFSDSRFKFTLYASPDFHAAVGAKYHFLLCYIVLKLILYVTFISFEILRPSKYTNSGRSIYGLWQECDLQDMGVSCLFKILNHQVIMFLLACQYDYFGQDCSEKCNDTCTACNNVNGSCDSRCIPGWMGEFCHIGKICWDFCFICLPIN